MTVSSHVPPVSLVETDLFSFLFSRNDRPFPDNKIVYQDADTLATYTYAEIRSLVVNFGEALKSRLAFKAGDVLLLVAPNDTDTSAIVLGTSYARGVVSPANPSYTVPELVFQLRDSKARLIVAHISTLSTVLAAAKEVGISRSAIFLLGNERDSEHGIKHFTSLLSASTPTARPTPVPSPKTTPAILAYSSGTTGRPKAVVLTHYNLTSNVLQIGNGGEAFLSWNGGSSNTPKDIPAAPVATYTDPNAGGDKILAVLPFFHIYGLMVHLFLPLWQGTHTLVMQRFELLRFCQLIQDHKVTYAYVVPPMALGLSKHPAVAKYDLSSLRMTNSAAAPMGPELVEAVWKKCKVRVKQSYGLSETSPGVTSQAWGEWWSARGSVGKLNANMEARFCEVGEPGQGKSAGAEVATGEVGELFVKGPNVFLKYLGNEEATRECLSLDGWFRTGDVAYIDKEGNVFITDRVKELIKYKGFQVAPAELEGVLLECPIVDDVAVVGVWDHDNGTEVPRAWVVRKGGIGHVRHGDEEQVTSWLAERAAGYKRLRGGVRWVESVPKSAAGKILRRILKDEAKKEEAETERKRGKARL